MGEHPVVAAVAQTIVDDHIGVGCSNLTARELLSQLPGLRLR